MQQPPPMGFSPFPQNGLQQQNGPPQQQFGPGGPPKQQFPGMNPQGDQLAGPMSNMQLDNQNRPQMPQTNGPPNPQFQQSPGYGGPPQQFRPNSAQPPFPPPSMSNGNMPGGPNAATPTPGMMQRGPAGNFPPPGVPPNMMRSQGPPPVPSGPPSLNANQPPANGPPTGTGASYQGQGGSPFQNAGHVPQQPQFSQQPSFVPPSGPPSMAQSGPQSLGSPPTSMSAGPPPMGQSNQNAPPGPPPGQSYPNGPPQTMPNSVRPTGTSTPSMMPPMGGQQAGYQNGPSLNSGLPSGPITNGPPSGQFQPTGNVSQNGPSMPPGPPGVRAAPPNNFQNGPQSAFQPPPPGGAFNSPPGVPPSRPTQLPQAIGQGYAQAPPSMYNGQLQQQGPGGLPQQPPGPYQTQAPGQFPQQGPPGPYPQQVPGQYPQQGPGQFPQQGPGQFPQQGPGGFQQQHGGYPQQHSAGYPQQQSPPEQRKLDPDNMPSPIQVIQDDRKLHNGTTFGTSRIGVMPPLVTTEAEIQDEGNAGPNYIRSTVYSVPCSPDVIKQTQVPLALALTPFARHAGTDGALPLTVFNEEIVRCNGCKAYMCPFMQFMDGGRRFQCVFCTTATEVPQSYFNHLDHVGDRVDKWQRAELCLGSYEITATQEYCRNQVYPKGPPAFIFVVDVSYNAMKSGMTQLFCSNIKNILQDLPVEEDDPEDAESQIRVGFITYSSQVHFYNIDPKLGQPKMMVVPDINDIFVPFVEGFLVKPKEAMQVIERLAAEIPKMFEDSRETEIILGPAIQAGLEALKEHECAGKLFVFMTTLPIAEAPGKLKNRDDRKLLGTDKEKTVLTPGCTFYQELGAQCVQAGCSVDLYVANNSFVDIASIGQVAKVTGGEIYKYTYFQPDVDGERFLADLRRNIAKPIAFDCVMRVRTSRGFRPTDFFGNLYIQNTTDVELASIDCDKCITVELKYDDKLPENDCAYIQVALLYTSVKGVRKLRLHNLKLQTTVQMADMYRNCELDVIMNFLSKQALRHLTEGTPKGFREMIIQRTATILANYRKHCATSSASGQLILPECMKLLPLYANCLTKCDAICGGPELTVDDRAFAMLAVSSMDVKSSQIYIYPRLLPVHNLNPDEDTIPMPIRTSVEKLSDKGAALLENGVNMFLYVGQNIDPVWCEAIFGVNTMAQIDNKVGLLPRNTPQSRRLLQLIDSIRAERSRFMKIYVVKQGDNWERVLRQFLVEDRISECQPSYVDYLCQMHKEIRDLIS